MGERGVVPHAEGGRECHRQQCKRGLSPVLKKADKGVGLSSPVQKIGEGEPVVGCAKGE